MTSRAENTLPASISLFALAGGDLGAAQTAIASLILQKRPISVIRPCLGINDHNVERVVAEIKHPANGAVIRRFRFIVEIAALEEGIPAIRIVIQSNDDAVIGFI